MNLFLKMIHMPLNRSGFNEGTFWLIIQTAMRKYICMTFFSLQSIIAVWMIRQNTPLIPGHFVDTFRCLGCIWFITRRIKCIISVNNNVISANQFVQVFWKWGFDIYCNFLFFLRSCVSLGVIRKRREGKIKGALHFLFLFACVCVCVCVQHACARAHINTSVIHTPARLGALPLSVDKHQNEGQGQQSQDTGPHGQGHWHCAWGRDTHIDTHTAD